MRQIGGKGIAGLTSGGSRQFQGWPDKFIEVSLEEVEFMQNDIRPGTTVLVYFPIMGKRDQPVHFLFG